MLQTVEVEVDINGSVRLLEPLKLARPTRALLTLLDPGQIERPSQGNVAALLDLLHSHRLPEAARPTPEEISAQIEEVRNSWE